MQEVEGTQQMNAFKMANMERRMDDMCILLERLMTVQTADQYYMAMGRTPTPVVMAGRYGYQELTLYSTPSGAYHDQALYLYETGDAPEDLHGVWPSHKESTLLLNHFLTLLTLYHTTFGFSQGTRPSYMAKSLPISAM
ncbi:hypothetical protein GGI05_000186 [Coemansia sp. RSA 2603]|nr:hypothetical protein GGI05_000186 [Coemansia sp. RSA 2603]